MKRSTYELLRCPACHQALSARDEPENEIVTANLVSLGCGRCYPPENGIVRLLDTSER